MRVSHRVLFPVAAGVLLLNTSARALPENPPIDRHALVSRHDVTWTDPCGVMPLGNGEFCFNADGTGLQTFGGNTMAQLGLALLLDATGMHARPGARHGDLRAETATGREQVPAWQ